VRLEGKLAGLKDDARLNSFLRALSRRDWVVYSKPPFGGPEQVLKYLARYTHRVAIANQRLLCLKDGKVTFRYKDYRCGNAKRTMTLEAVEFIRRFLQHVLPASFHRIRYFGFLGNRVRKKSLELARNLLSADSLCHESPSLPPPRLDDSSPAETTSSAKESICPACKEGQLVIAKSIPPCLGALAFRSAATIDSS
jgi:hypothetical protein